MGSSHLNRYLVIATLAVLVMFAPYGSPAEQAGWIGVGVEDIKPEWVDMFGITGAEVVKVEKGGPADRAGIKKGDIIIRCRDRPVINAEDLKDDIATSGIGNEVFITVLRDHQEHKTRVKVENRPSIKPTIHGGVS